MNRTSSGKRKLSCCCNTKDNVKGSLELIQPVAKKAKQQIQPKLLPPTPPPPTKIHKRDLVTTPTIPAPENVVIGKVQKELIPKQNGDDDKDDKNGAVDLDREFIKQCFMDSGKTINSVNLLSIDELETYLSVLKKHPVIPQRRFLKQCVLLPPMNDFYQVLNILNKLVTKVDASSMLKKRKEGTAYVFGPIGSSFCFSFPEQKQKKNKDDEDNQT